MRALFNDQRCPFAGGEPTEVSEALLGNDDVQVVLGLVDVRGEGDDAGYPCRVCFGWAAIGGGDGGRGE